MCNGQVEHVQAVRRRPINGHSAAHRLDALALAHYVQARAADGLRGIRQVSRGGQHARRRPLARARTAARPGLGCGRQLAGKHVVRRIRVPARPLDPRAQVDDVRRDAPRALRRVGVRRGPRRPRGVPPHAGTGARVDVLPRAHGRVPYRRSLRPQHARR